MLKIVSNVFSGKFEIICSQSCAAIPSTPGKQSSFSNFPPCSLKIECPHRRQLFKCFSKSKLFF